MEQISLKDDDFLRLTGMMVNTDKSNYTSINADTTKSIAIYDRIKQHIQQLRPNDPTKSDKTLGFRIEPDLKWKGAQEEMELYIDKTLTILNRKTIGFNQARWVINHVLGGYCSYRLQLPYFPNTILKTTRQQDSKTIEPQTQHKRQFSRSIPIPHLTHRVESKITIQ